MHQINHIMIVEDDPITTIIIKRLIEKELNHCKISTYLNGELALNAILNYQKENVPDLILLDINMPVMNGWELLDALRAKKIDLTTPVMMLTSSIDKEDIEKSRTYPTVKGYFYKPLDTTKLKQIIGIIQATK